MTSSLNHSIERPSPSAVLRDLYVFIAKATRESAIDLVSCYDNDEEIEKTIAVYKAPFRTRTTSATEKVEFVSEGCF